MASRSCIELQKFCDLLGGGPIKLAKEPEHNPLTSIELAKHLRPVVLSSASIILCSTPNILKCLSHSNAKIFHPAGDVGVGPTHVVVVRWSNGDGIVVRGQITGVVFLE